MTQGDDVRTAPRTVLIVDPDADTRALYAFTLERDHWSVAEAVSGADGFELAVQLRPEVVVTELAMPGVDGFELCLRLKSVPATHDIPVVVVTASAFPKDVERATQAGGDIVVCKPCLPAQLLALVNRVGARGRSPRSTSLG